MSLPERGTVIEGIGDEIIFALSVLIFIVLPSIAYVYYRASRFFALQSIDPASQETVDSVREEINQQRESAGRHTMRPREGEVNCPICLTNAKYAVQTNCGHTFCGRCMVTYWRHGHWVSGLRCPVCRTQVNILLRFFSAEEQTNRTPEREEVISEVNTYNRRFSGEPIPWLDYIRDLPTLLRHMLTELFSVGGMVVMFRLRILVLFAAALLYFLSPLDIIPEAVFGILGFIDDLFILLLLAVYVSILYRRFVVQRAMHDQRT